MCLNTWKSALSDVTKGSSPRLAATPPARCSLLWKHQQSISLRGKLKPSILAGGWKQRVKYAVFWSFFLRGIIDCSRQLHWRLGKRERKMLKMTTMGPLNVPLWSLSLPPLLTTMVWKRAQRHSFRNSLLSGLSSPFKHHKPTALTPSTHKMRIITSLLFPLCHFVLDSAQTLPNLGGAT